MADCEKNLGVRIGDTIIHKNLQYTIVNIECQEIVEGSTLLIRALDTDMALREQQKNMSNDRSRDSIDQTRDQVLDMIKKITKDGGDISGIGFGMGG
jgi:GH35 family endo-1,4-beta-xylanase